MASKFYFLQTKDILGRPRLRALPGQFAADGTPIFCDLNIQADSIIRGSYPVGTVFGTQVLELRTSTATHFYSAASIFPLNIAPDQLTTKAHAPSKEMLAGYEQYKKSLENIDSEEAATKPTSLRAKMKATKKLAVPTIASDGFWVDEETWLLLARNLKQKINTLLVGQTGTGKSELCLLACKKLGIPCNVYDMGSMHDPLSQLLGTHRLKNGASVFEYARFVGDVQKPGVILLDELSRAPLGTANILFSCLDSQRTLHVEMAGGEGLQEIKVHPDCVFIATANVGAEYTGTFSMDRALISRFFPIEFQYMPNAEEAKVLTKRYGINTADAVNIVSVASTVRNLFNKQELSCTISTRETLAAASLVADGWTALKAMELVYLPLFEGTRDDGERSVVHKIFLTR